MYIIRRRGWEIPGKPGHAGGLVLNRRSVLAGTAALGVAGAGECRRRGPCGRADSPIRNIPPAGH